MKKVISLLVFISLNACTSISQVPVTISTPSKLVIVKPHNSFTSIKAKKLPDYIQDSMHELINNITHVKPQSVIAVTSFVFTDSDFNNSPLFAGQIKESYIYEFHKLGQPIIELRSSGLIKVTDKGEFFLTRDYRQLRAEQPIDYLLVGTISRLRNGVMLNARIIGAESFAVVGASQLFIPQATINNYISSAKTSRRIKLIKG
jgi:TolB-like protein